jgi:hypothetical protein
MVEMHSIVVFIFCLVGCGIHSYFLGKRVGIMDCLGYLEDQGVIEFEENIDE